MRKQRCGEVERRRRKRRRRRKDIRIRFFLFFCIYQIKKKREATTWQCTWRCSKEQRRKIYYWSSR
jgi:hypothetical protein